MKERKKENSPIILVVEPKQPIMEEPAAQHGHIENEGIQLGSNLSELTDRLVLF